MGVSRRDFVGPLGYGTLLWGLFGHDQRLARSAGQRRGDKAARVGQWKWVDSAKGSGLFDLSKDIGEKQDLSRENPEMLDRVKARFAAWQHEMKEAEPRGPFRDY